MENNSNQKSPILLYCARDKSSQSVDEFSVPNNEDILWIHITPSNKNDLKKYIDLLNIHPLAAEAITSFSEFPRIDVYNHHAYISTFVIKEDYSNVRISILFSENYVITHEEENNLEIFSTLSEDFSDHPNHMSSPGHIIFHILDHVSKFYFQVIDKISDEILALEKSVFKSPFANEIGRKVYNWKGKIHDLRQIVEAQESMIKDIGQSDITYIDEDAMIYLKTLENKFQRVVSAFDIFIENLTGVFDLQMSLKSDHMNSIMKTLTLVSVIFIPMNFIAGMYGMNFKHMPELSWKFGYLYSLILMFGVGISIALYFRKKGWWGKPSNSDRKNN